MGDFLEAKAAKERCANKCRQDPQRDFCAAQRAGKSIGEQQQNGADPHGNWQQLLVVIATEESADVRYNQPNPADNARDGNGTGGD